MKKVPGVDMSLRLAGPGHLRGCGMAKAAKLQNADCASMRCWATARFRKARCGRAAMFASHYHLDNLCVLVGQQRPADRRQRRRRHVPIPIDEKFKASVSTSSTSTATILTRSRPLTRRPAPSRASRLPSSPRLSRAKGVSFMENQASWHGTAPNDEQYEVAMKELGEQLKSLSANLGTKGKDKRWQK